MKNLKAFERLVFSIFILMTLMACGDSEIGGGSSGFAGLNIIKGCTITVT
jgi:hypothetical protein